MNNVDMKSMSNHKYFTKEILYYPVRQEDISSEEITIAIEINQEERKK